MGEYAVYMHMFPNGKMHVGITSQDVSRRWRDGKGYYGQTVYNAILKYGWDNITHKILFEGLTKEQAEEKEIELIKRYKTTSHENGYNVELGGNAVGKVSEERGASTARNWNLLKDYRVCRKSRQAIQNGRWIPLGI